MQRLIRWSLGLTAGPAIDWWLFAGLLAVNGLVAINAVLHSPFVGYDAWDHLAYIAPLAEGRLPGPDISAQYFSPPLPYLPGALMRAWGSERWGVVFKFAQLVNVAWSMVLTLTLVRWCNRITVDTRLARWSLFLLGTMPVYYKSMAMVRGEPANAALAVVLAAAAVMLTRDAIAVRGSAYLGLLCGLALLSRQWAAFVVGPVLLLVAAARGPSGIRLRATNLAVIGAVAIAVSGGFYLSLHQRFGSIAAFNQAPRLHWSLSNRPPDFFTDTGWPDLIVHPVRPRLGDDGTEPLLPILYSETWGDYWCYWSVWGIDPPTGGWASGKALIEIEHLPDLETNRATMAPYLGRVNLVSILPSLILLAGVLLALTVTGRPRAGLDVSVMLSGWIVAATVAGYFVLLLKYPTLGVKATYLLQAVPFAAIAGAHALTRFADASPRASRVVRFALVACALHNAPLFVTRFIWW